MVHEEEERRRIERIVEPLDLTIKNERIRDIYRQTPEFDEYERLCRGEKTKVYRLENHFETFLMIFQISIVFSLGFSFLSSIKYIAIVRPWCFLLIICIIYMIYYNTVVGSHIS